MVWLVSGLLWRHWRTSETSENVLTRLRTVSVFCGVLFVVGFVVLPSVPIASTSTAGVNIAGIEAALYAVNVPFLALSEVYAPLWLLLLAGVLCFVGTLLSRHGDVRVLSLTLFLASVTAFAVGWGWWLEQLTFTTVTVSQGAVLWLIALSVVVVWLLSRRAEQRETVFVTWVLLVASWLWLGLTSPGAEAQVPGLANYYTWLEPASSALESVPALESTSALESASALESVMGQTMADKQLAYGGWLLVAVAALPLSVAVASTALIAETTMAETTLTKRLVNKTPTNKKSTHKTPERVTTSAERTSVQQRNVWLEGTSLALFVLIFTLACRYVVTLNAPLLDAPLDVFGVADEWSRATREQTITRLLDWRTWLRIVPPYSLQTWWVATLQTAAVALVARTVGWVLQRLLLQTRQGLRRMVVQLVRMMRLLLVLGFVVAWLLEWQPAAVLWLLALVALLDTDIQPTVVRSVLLGVLLGQGLGGLILRSLQVGSGLGLLAVAVAVWGVQWGGSRCETHLVKCIS